MPFQSEAQRRFMWMKHPEIARRWAHEFPGQKNLPMHKKSSISHEAMSTVVRNHIKRKKKNG